MQTSWGSKSQTCGALLTLLVGYESRQVKAMTWKVSATVGEGMHYQTQEGLCVCHSAGLAKGFSQMTVVELRKELSSRALPTSGVKATLLNRLTQAVSSLSLETETLRRSESCQEDERSPMTRLQAPARGGKRSARATPPQSRQQSEDGVGHRGHVVLVLDESLQCLPWESLALLRGQNVSRSPSLAQVVEALKTSGSGAQLAPSIEVSLAGCA
jgi:hypothetical protein